MVGWFVRWLSNWLAGGLSFGCVRGRSRSSVQSFHRTNRQLVRFLAWLICRYFGRSVARLVDRIYSQVLARLIKSSISGPHICLFSRLCFFMLNPRESLPSATFWTISRGHRSLPFSPPPLVLAFSFSAHRVQNSHCWSAFVFFQLAKPHFRRPTKAESTHLGQMIYLFTDRSSRF